MVHNSLHFINFLCDVNLYDSALLRWSVECSLIVLYIVYIEVFVIQSYYTHTHPFDCPLSGTTRVSWYQKGKTNLDLLKQETVSGSGISWVMCKSAPRSRQITTPASHQAGCPSCRQTNSVRALKAKALKAVLQSYYLHKMNVSPINAVYGQLSISIAYPTGRPRAHHKTFISPYPSVHISNEIVMC